MPPAPGPEQLEPLMTDVFELPVPGKMLVWLALEPDGDTIKDILTGIGSKQTNGGSGLNRLNELVALGVLQITKDSDTNGRHHFSFTQAGAKAVRSYLLGRVADYDEAIDNLDALID